MAQLDKNSAFLLTIVIKYIYVDTNMPDANIPAGPQSLQAVLAKFDQIRDALLIDVGHDRANIQYYIDLIKARIELGQDSQYHWEALTSLLATMTRAPADSIRILDSMAKMVSACKNITDIQPDSDADLDELIKKTTFDETDP